MSSDTGVSTAALQAINAAFAAAAADLRAALQASQDDAARLAGERDGLKAELEAQQASSAAAAAAAQARLHELEHDAGELRRQLAQTATALADSRAREGEQRNALDAAAASAAGLEAELRTLQAQQLEEAAAHRLAAAGLEEGAAALQQELGALRAECRQHQLQLQGAEAIRRGHEQQLAELGAAMSALRAHEAALQMALQEAAAAASAENAAQAQRVAGLEREARGLQQRVEHQAAAHRYEVEQLQVRLGAATVQIDNLRTENNDLREAHASELQAERARAAHAAADAALQVEARGREWTQLRAAWEQAVAQREAALRAAQARLRGAQEQAQWLGWTRERLQARIDEGQSRELRLLQQWQAARAEAQVLRHQLAAAPAAAAPAAAPHVSAAPIPASAPQEVPAMNETPLDIQHVNQLLALRGARFVRAAYRAILGREPEADGLANYLDRIRSEHDKVAVVYALATSAEGAVRPRQLAGLSELLAELRPRDGRSARWLQRVAMGFSSVRRVEVAVDTSADELTARLDAVEARLAQLEAQLAARLEQSAASLGSSLAACQASVSACEQQLAALPTLLDGKLEALLQAQRLVLQEALPKGPAPAAEAPAAPSARQLQLDAAGGATALMGQLSEALGASQEAAMLSRGAGS